MTAAVSIAIIVIGVYAFIKTVEFIVESTKRFLYIRQVERTIAQQEANFEKERKKREKVQRNIQEEFEVKRQARLNEGLEEIGQNHWLFLRKDDTGRPISLFNLDGKRIPLARLAECREAEIIGVNPTIYFRGHKVTPAQMRRDEYEIATQS